MRLILATIALLVLSGCAAGTLVNVITAPVRVAGKAVDLATTSQSEADEKRGRQLREREARYGELSRSYARENARCAKGKDDACDKAAEIHRKMDALRDTLPAEPD